MSECLAKLPTRVEGRSEEEGGGGKERRRKEWVREVCVCGGGGWMGGECVCV